MIVVWLSGRVRLPLAMAHYSARVNVRSPRRQQQTLEDSRDSSARCFRVDCFRSDQRRRLKSELDSSVRPSEATRKEAPGAIAGCSGFNLIFTLVDAALATQFIFQSTSHATMTPRFCTFALSALALALCCCCTAVPSSVTSVAADSSLATPRAFDFQSFFVGEIEVKKIEAQFQGETGRIEVAPLTGRYLLQRDNATQDTVGQSNGHAE